jgi:hypothetical protein
MFAPQGFASPCRESGGLDSKTGHSRRNYLQIEVCGRVEQVVCIPRIRWPQVANVVATAQEAEECFHILVQVALLEIDLSISTVSTVVGGCIGISTQYSSACLGCKVFKL